MNVQNNANRQGKRGLENPIDSQNKRVKVENSSLLSLPYEVLQFVFSHFSKNQLLCIGQTCNKFNELTESFFSEFRKKDRSVVDFTCCLRRQAANYFLTRKLLTLVTSLKKCSSQINKKVYSKIEPTCKHIVPFNALVKLLEVSKYDEIPQGLIKELEKDVIFNVIKDIYLFSRNVHLNKGKGKNAKMRNLTKIEKNNFEKSIQPKIEDLFAKGAIFISTITTKLFSRFYLIDKRSNDPFATQFAAKLALNPGLLPNLAG